jgi:hypothetical protein
MCDRYNRYKPNVADCEKSAAMQLQADILTR